MQKVWSISTAVRNPERIRSFLKILSSLEYKIWNKETQIIEKNGVITQISGYTAGLTKANCNSSSFWRRSRSWRRR